MSDIRDFCPLWGEWQAEEKIGEGSFGAVWKMKRNVVGGKVFYAAVKHIPIPGHEGETDRLIAEGICSGEESAKHYYARMLQAIADEIEQELQGKLDREISTVEIGEMVMKRLKEVDEVAYVRFASVYRSFKDINTFMEELSKLLTEPK